MKAIPYNLVLLFIVTYLTACDKDDETRDTTPPEITLNAPAEGAELKIGEAIHFDAYFEDDVMLRSYKVEIHDNFKEHGHGSKAGDSEEVAFAYIKDWDLSGMRTKNVHHHEIVIPDNATPGKYHLLVYCSDAQGNESYIARNIVLSHDAETSHDHD